MPDIPGSVQSLTGPFLWQVGDTVFCTVLNSDCPGSASAIAGRHAIDDNGNGLLDAGEPAFPWGRVLIQPMNALVPAGAGGWWERGAQPGTYTIEPNSTYPYLISSAPAQHTATFVALGEVDSTNHFAHTLLPGVNDLQVSAYAVPPRPGFNNDLILSYRNFGTTSLPATLQLAVDADQSFVGSSPAPTTLVGNSATWDLGTLPLGAQGQVLVTLHTDATVPLGTPVQHTAVIDPVAGDTVPSNNTTLWTDTVVGAYDPNDKLLDIPAATPADVQADAITLTYTIRFQNTGTYPAERVVILDSLSDDLQWNSFEFLSSSHPCQWYMLDGVLHFIFDPILLPDSGSNEPASHGFVRFRMRPSTQLTNGDQVDNIAHIVFDFNTPIVTPPATFRVDMSTGLQEQAVGTLTVMPNPTRDRLLIGGFAGTAALRVLDLSGRLLRSARGSAPALLDVADLRPGTYLLEVRTPQRAQAVRFVKE
ncbi:MAG: T9SS type A sorting domain-containing protein [Flavobacteriales bacterium]|nr:T9SS type A sorting domain-containing protein [Flavobacteriales bacterium]